MFLSSVCCPRGGAGTRRTNQDLADSAFFWGIAKIHRYGRNVRAVSWEQVSQARKDRMARELSTLAKRVERGVGKVRPGLRTKAFFYPNSVDAEAGLERSRPGILAGKRLDRARPSLEESLTLPGARGEVLAPNDGQMDGFVLQ